MTLQTGTKYGPYEILAPLGAGGMGEVYRARDTRLDRIVAIKVLPSHLSTDPQLRERFEREARAVSSLNHPNICTLHDIGRQNGTDYLIMEYIEGETLQARLQHGSIPTTEMLQHAIQIADALDKAHKNGIVHRDLKPGNIMLTRNGVKLLDFGLARMESVAAMEVSTLPTEQRELTKEGTILGTIHYMAPEQLEGKKVDARSDIFSFGAVMYEMATGKKAFEGNSQASVIAAILKETPEPIDRYQPLTPPVLQETVQTCLAKDPDDRWQSTRDLLRQLRWIQAGQTLTAATMPANPANGPLNIFRVAAIAVTAFLLGAVGTLMLQRAQPQTEARLIQSTIPAPEDHSFVNTSLYAGPVAISPGGMKIVFTAQRGEQPPMLWVRSLNETAARPLVGTDNGARPFWSPDSRYIGFFADRKLKRIDANGGPVSTLADAIDGRGGTWNAQGVILFAPDAQGPLYRVSASGGEAVPVTELSAQPSQTTHRYPQFLPDGRHFLFLGRRAVAGPGSEPGLFVGSLDSKEVEKIVNAGSNAIYASGQLLYVRDGALMAQAFDAEDLQTTGEAKTIVDQILMDTRFSRGVFDASENGMLVYQTGIPTTRTQLKWMDRNGTVLGALGTPAEFFTGGVVQISPDGKLATATIVDLGSGNADIWLIDLASGIRNRFTLGANDKYYSTWSPDGTRVAYSVSNEVDGYDIVAKSVTGAGREETLLKAQRGVRSWVADWSPDGRYLIYEEYSEKGNDLKALPLFGDRKPFMVAATKAWESLPQFSPDGEFVAYSSNENGRSEVYVTAFPEISGRWQVSQNGGSEPRWSHDGRQLYFFASDNRLMEVEIDTNAGVFQIKKMESLFQIRSAGDVWRYNLSKDGRFLVNTAMPAESFSPITLVWNWPLLLKQPVR